MLQFVLVVFINSVRTSQKTQCVSITETNRLMLFRVEPEKRTNFHFQRRVCWNRRRTEARNSAVRRKKRRVKERKRKNLKEQQ
jgi:hypothetical protein